MFQTIQNAFGEFKSYYEPKKKRANIVIDSCANEESLLKSIQEFVLSLGLTEAFITPHGLPMFQSLQPDYDIGTYESNQEYNPVTGYELISLDEEMYERYMDITNRSTFHIDNMSYVEPEELIESKNTEGSNIGLILFDGKYIGTYFTVGEEIESFAIDPDYQGLGHGKNSFQTVLSTIKGNKQMLVASSNTVALNLYIQFGFKKTDRFISYWYHLKY